MSNIYVLGAQRWLKLPTRTQWLLTQLNHSHQILYFQPSPYRFSRSPHKSDFQRPCLRPQPNIAVYTLPPVFQVSSDEEHRFLLASNRRVWLKYIREKLSAHQCYNALLWVSSPVYAPILDDLDYRGMVYDCFRYWGQYDIHWESLVAFRADVIFAASPSLIYRLSECNRNIALLPDGGDLTLFRLSEDLTLSAPASIQRLRGTLLGYLGDVGQRTDLRPVCQAARFHPGWHFVFAGRLNRDNPDADLAEELPNVHFLGKVSRSDLPRYAAHFQVLFDLLDTSDPDEDVVPSRIYEYLAVGKPLVAMYPKNFSAVYPDVIYGAKNSAEFVDACQQAVMENSGWAVKSRKEYAREASWEVRAKTAEQVLERNSLL